MQAERLVRDDGTIVWLNCIYEGCIPLSPKAWVLVCQNFSSAHFFEPVILWPQSKLHKTDLMEVCGVADDIFDMNGRATIAREKCAEKYIQCRKCLKRLKSKANS